MTLVEIKLNEITVVTEIRPSPDSSDILFVRQKLAVVDGTLCAVGDPSEEKNASGDKAGNNYATCGIR